MIDLETARSVAKMVMRPMVKLCLRSGLHLSELTEMLKEILVEEGQKQLGPSATGSAITLLTGVHRKDVTRLINSREPSQSNKPRSIPGRVLGMWQHAQKFIGSDGQPADLTAVQFHELATSVSTDVNPRSVLAELIRSKRVLENSNSTGEKVLKLNHPTYVSNEDATDGYKLCSDDIESLLDTVERNVAGLPEEAGESSSEPIHHLRTEYDRIRASELPQINRWLLEEGHAFHARARDFLAKFDNDINPVTTNNHPDTEITVSITSFASNSQPITKEELL